MAYLLIEIGPDTGARFELVANQSTIGRHPDCEVPLKEAGRVSRHHAQINREGDAFVLRDLGSRNGTFLNDEQISQDPQPLTDRDRIRVCDVEFVFRQSVPGMAKPPSTLGYVPAGSDAAQLEAVVVEDEGSEEAAGSTIMSTLDISRGTEGALHLSASLESRLSALIEITRSLGKALALDEVLPQVLNSLFKIFLQADRGFIVLETEDGHLIPRWTQARKQGDEDTIRISRTIIKHVMDSKEAILSADATQDDRLDMSQSIADLRIRSMMCAPLLDSEGNALGAIQVDTLDQRKRFRQEDLEVLASVAIQAGIAIDNAQLHDAALRQKEIEQDLLLAQEVQQSFLPANHPELQGYEFFAYYRAANHIGGDYYDYIQLPDGRIAVIVADVVGHGVAAAMMMAKLSAEAKYCLASENDPGTAITRLNNRLSTMETDRFVTLIMVVLDPKEGEATIVNAGHMAPVWRRKDGDIEEPGEDQSGLPIGIMEGFDYEQATISLVKGESLTMYTDGLNEAMDKAGEQFTIERIRDHIQAQGGSTDLETVGKVIIDDVTQFVGDGPQIDDMCLVTLRRV